MLFGLLTPLALFGAGCASSSGPGNTSEWKTYQTDEPPFNKITFQYPADYVIGIDTSYGKRALRIEKDASTWMLIATPDTDIQIPYDSSAPQDEQDKVVPKHNYPVPEDKPLFGFLQFYRTGNTKAEAELNQIIKTAKMNP